MKKSKSSRGAPATEIVTLKSDRSWSTLKSQIRSHISIALDQPFPELCHYNVSFTVPCQVSDPILLLDEIKYKYMVKKALSIQKSPNAKIVVKPKVTHRPSHFYSVLIGFRNRRRTKKMTIQWPIPIAPNQRRRKRLR